MNFCMIVYLLLIVTALIPLTCAERTRISQGVYVSLVMIGALSFIVSVTIHSAVGITCGVMLAIAPALAQMIGPGTQQKSVSE